MAKDKKNEADLIFSEPGQVWNVFHGQGTKVVQLPWYLWLYRCPMVRNPNSHTTCIHYQIHLEIYVSWIFALVCIDSCLYWDWDPLNSQTVCQGVPPISPYYSHIPLLLSYPPTTLVSPWTFCIPNFLPFWGNSGPVSGRKLTFFAHCILGLRSTQQSGCISHVPLLCWYEASVYPYYARIPLNLLYPPTAPIYPSIAVYHICIDLWVSAKIKKMAPECDIRVKNKLVLSYLIYFLSLRFLECSCRIPPHIFKAP